MQETQENFIPVYLFLGFLEAGKTKFIQKMLEDEQFHFEQNILLLICEEGEEEYDSSQFPGNHIFIHVIEEKEELNEANLLFLADKYHAECIMIEYNGMWHLKDILSNKPDNWKIFQTVLVADAFTFLQYHASFKNLVTDKLNLCELVVFNRFEHRVNPEELHKIVRAVNWRTLIYYEMDNGELSFYDIQDPLPFDLNADPIMIKDEYYALWYQDIMAEAKKYQDKTIVFRTIIDRNADFPPDVYIVGRNIMTCCVEDMAFSFFLAQYHKAFTVRQNHWALVTAKIMVQHHAARNADIPILNILHISDCTPPETETALFT